MNNNFFLRSLQILVVSALSLTLASCGAGRSSATLSMAKSKPKGPSWIKICDPQKVCKTQHERLHAKNGLVLISAEIVKRANKKPARLRVTVPLGMMLQASLRVFVDQNKKPYVIPFAVCNNAGCIAETRFTPKMQKAFFNGTRLTIGVFRYGKPIGFRIPLNGIETAYNGAPYDRKKYLNVRKTLLAKIRKRRRALLRKAQQQPFNNQLFGEAFSGADH